MEMSPVLTVVRKALTYANLLLDFSGTTERWKCCQMQLGSLHIYLIHSINFTINLCVIFDIYDE